MSTSTSKPVTTTQARLIVAYLAIALARQAAHDLRNLIRWARPR